MARGRGSGLKPRLWLALRGGRGLAVESWNVVVMGSSVRQGSWCLKWDKVVHKPPALLLREEATEALVRALEV